MAVRSEKQKQIETLVSETHFDEAQVKHLWKLFGRLAGDDEKIDRLGFREMLHKSFDMTDDLMMDRVFIAFCTPSEPSMDRSRFIRGMSVFLKGTQAEQIDFVFKTYDLNNDNQLVKDEMLVLLKNTMVKATTEEDRDEGTKDLIDMIVQKMDKDKDGVLSKEDYIQSVEKDPLLLEAFGPCLPKEQDVAEFLSDAVFETYK